MISVTTLLHHLSWVSFIEILIVNYEQSHRYQYRTVLVYIESNDPLVCDVSDHIVQTLSSRCVVPVILGDCNGTNRITPSYGQRNLNIILINNRSSITKIKRISNSFYASDDKIIVLVNDLNDSSPFSQEFVQTVDFLNQFVLIGPNSVMVAFHLYRRTFHIKAYRLDMYNRHSVISHFQKVYDHRRLSLNGTQIRVFLSYSPPWSIVCPSDSSLRFYKFVGIDVLVTEFVLFHLNATIVLTSDLAIEEPNYARWFTLQKRKSLQIKLLHGEVFGDTEITEFNARCLLKETYSYKIHFKSIEYNSIKLTISV